MQIWDYDSLSYSLANELIFISIGWIFVAKLLYEKETLKSLSYGMMKLQKKGTIQCKYFFKIINIDVHLWKLIYDTKIVANKLQS